MSSHTTYVELRKRYATGWTPPPTEYPNEAFTKPTPAVFWARFSINDGDEYQMDIGSDIKTFRTSGLCVVQLFFPLSVGIIDILQKADIVAGIFRNWCGATVTCRSASIKNIGADGFGWYQMNIVTPFKVDALH